VTTTHDVGANKAVVARLSDEGFNRQDPDVLDDVCAPSFVHHWGVAYEMPLAEYKAGVQRLYQGLPDLSATTEHVVAEEDKVAVRYRFKGTHQGELAGAAPTGNEVEWTSTFIYRVEDGRIEEDWEDYDYSAFPTLLGADEDGGEASTDDPAKDAAMPTAGASGDDDDDDDGDGGDGGDGGDKEEGDSDSGGGDSGDGGSDGGGGDSGSGDSGGGDSGSGDSGGGGDSGGDDSGGDGDREAKSS